ncbi:MAG: sigma-70 family RNA polymerase sigma factor [Caulobacterales bacterium]
MNIANITSPPTSYSQAELIPFIPHMRAFARSLCRDATQADDLTQDALLSAWRRRSTFTAGTNLKAWLFMIVRNQFYSDQRRSWRVTQLDPTVAEETLVAVSNANGALELDEVRRAMLELPDEQREALTLIGVAGVAYHEAAMICGCAEGTIKSRVNRARLRVAAILAGGNLRDDRQPPGKAMASMFAAVDLGRKAAA